MWCLFFVGAVLSALALPTYANTTCLNQIDGQPIKLTRVTDGDTIVLSDQRRVRLIGLNALERNAASDQDRALAERATQTLETLLAEQPLQLVTGIDAVDRHGRTLGHVRLPDGRIASHTLIRQGLALAVAIGRNTRCASQSLAAENVARQQRRGVWRHPGDWYLDGNSLPARARGFHLVKSTVKSVQGKGRQRTLLLNNGLHVKLGRDWPARSDLPLPPLQELIGQPVEVRGWLGSAKGKTTLTLHHPANLAVISH